MDKRTRIKIIVFLLLVALIITVVIYHNIIVIRQGEADYSSMLEGKPPFYAKMHSALSDGGTVCYKGNGYSVYRVHSLHLENGVEGYLVGPKMRYSPFVFGGKNKESLRFEAETEEEP